MSHFDDRADDTDAARVLIEELLRTALALGGALASLLDDLPEDAFPGEDSAVALIEMVVGSCRPAIAAAGEPDCRRAAALVGAIRYRVLDDLRVAAELARPTR